MDIKVLQPAKENWVNLFHSLQEGCSYTISPLVKSTSSCGEVEGSLING